MHCWPNGRQYLLRRRHSRSRSRHGSYNGRCNLSYWGLVGNGVAHGICSHRRVMLHVTKATECLYHSCWQESVRQTKSSKVHRSKNTDTQFDCEVRF
jgi:hypothetical protein